MPKMEVTTKYLRDFLERLDGAMLKHEAAAH